MITVDPLTGLPEFTQDDSYTEISGFAGNSSSSTSFSIPEVTADPTTPNTGDAWVLHSMSGGSGSGTPMGMLLALTYTGSGTNTYQLSYYTTEGTIIRTSMS